MRCPDCRKWMAEDPMGAMWCEDHGVMWYPWEEIGKLPEEQQ